MIREKYIEDRFPRYFEFGAHSNGNVDVSSSTIDPIVTMPKNKTHILINDRDIAINMLVKLAQKLDEVSPKEFTKIWDEGE